MRNHLADIIFNMWMDKHHPWFAPIVGILFCILVLSFIASIVCIWVVPDIWIPLMITTVGATIIFRIVVRMMNRMYVDEFLRSKGRQ